MVNENSTKGNSQETAPENLYYEISVSMVKFLASLYWDSATMGFMDSNCEPLFDKFEAVRKEIKERCPDLYMNIENTEMNDETM